ncbi:DUF1120 domain-containing protein [Yersinia enterocolitica]|uniref:Beta-fimbriae major subunit n=2 Tax=Yersinia enterocolitica TaxID=630 RepID=A0A9P1V3F5_YEREN|nr:MULTISPECIES: DUF1120 domain-containing protein [Yersinia]AKF38441.1 beta-fimbriae major subunit [Yersinia enterocolitica]ALG44976.1 beta-fimbriae major subunit [Yersinia enterocolitica]EKN3337363.1 DUF1120 domain-containing protein [Yersinia enterocolitica]EKN3341566.1 DUF1120 domain-containing protein [Yersinia enterocolitica]EKN3385590.1 DUF1120 domain-containing protein [Yersinia enterocolitica]
MKKQLAGITVLPFLIVSIATAYAVAPVAELKVKGALTVPSCTVNAPDNGIYDFGKISSTKISSSVFVNLAAMTKNWVITCDATTYLTVKPIDNRAASVYPPSTSTYGLGMVNGSGKIGGYTINMQNAVVDGNSSKLFSSSTGLFSAVTETALYNHGPSVGWASADNTQAAGKVFSTDIKVAPILASTTAMNGPITEDTELNGSVTLNFAYAI